MVIRRSSGVIPVPDSAMVRRGDMFGDAGDKDGDDSDGDEGSWGYCVIVLIGAGAWIGATVVDGGLLIPLFSPSSGSHISVGSWELPVHV